MRYIGYGVRHANNAFSQVSTDLVDAARITGATPLQTLRDILVPAGTAVDPVAVDRVVHLHLLE